MLKPEQAVELADKVHGLTKDLSREEMRQVMDHVRTSRHGGPMPPNADPKGKQTQLRAAMAKLRGAVDSLKSRAPQHG